MPLQIGIFVAESVKSGTKRLEDGANVAYVAYIVLVSQ